MGEADALWQTRGTGGAKDQGHLILAFDQFLKTATEESHSRPKSNKSIKK